MRGVESHSPAQFLKAQLLGRISRNPSYSVRAFARDLRISHSYLSQLLNERRRLSFRQAVQISDALNLSKEEKERFIQSLLEKRDVSDSAGTPVVETSETTVAMDMDRFRTVKEWYH